MWSFVSFLCGTLWSQKGSLANFSHILRGHDDGGDHAKCTSLHCVAECGPETLAGLSSDFCAGGMFWVHSNDAATSSHSSHEDRPMEAQPSTSAPWMHCAVCCAAAVLFPCNRPNEVRNFAWRADLQLATYQHLGHLVVRYASILSAGGHWFKRCNPRMRAVATCRESTARDDALEASPRTGSREGVRCHPGSQRAANRAQVPPGPRQLQCRPSFSENALADVHERPGMDALFAPCA